MVSPDALEAQRQLQRLRGQALADKVLGQSRARQDYRQFANILNQGLSRDKQSIMDDFASRGLYNSGIRQGVEGEAVEDYYNQIQSGGTTLQRQLEDLTRQSTRTQSGGYAGLEGALFQSTRGGVSNLLNQALNQAKSNIYRSQ